MSGAGDEPTLPILGEDEGGGGVRPESGEDEDWLMELVSCHRGGQLQVDTPRMPAMSEAGDEGERSRPESSDDEDWLVELISCHRGGEPQVDTEEPEMPEEPLQQVDTPRIEGPGFRVPHMAEVASGGRECGCGGIAACSSIGPLQLAIVADVAGRGLLDAPWHNREDMVRFASSLGIVRTVEPPKGNAVVWYLPPSAPMFSNFEHCVRCLVTWMVKLGPLAFKIGIAADPIERWTNSAFGYLHDRQWHVMEVCWRGPANICRALEIDLIAATRGISGCYNDSPGGEGVRPDRTHTCFVYLVCAAAGTGMSLRKTWELRARQAVRS
jgi:hypothetical protein